MKYVTEGYEPRDIYQYFEDISRIPRGSRKEKAIADYVCAFGKGLGLEVIRDEANNVIIRKPASLGCEHLPYVVLQGHMDMVCVKLPESTHNFDTDPIPLVIDREKGILKADGTTLGADDGCAVAYMMAILARKDLVHPPLECLFTTGEEIGLKGAYALDINLLKGKRLINMDFGTLDMGICVVSSAGGIELLSTRKAEWQPAEGSFLQIFLHGLQGGHSGGAIHKGRGNAGKILARVLNHMTKKTEITIAMVNGGNMQNAIMSDIRAVVRAGDPEAAKDAALEMCHIAKEELRVTDPGFLFEIAEAEKPEKMLTQEMSDALLGFALTVPHGVMDMNPEIPGAVLNSTNLSAIQLNDERALIWTLGRGNEDSRQDATAEVIRALAKAYGFSVEMPTYMESWKYNPESKMRALHERMFKEHFGKDMRHLAVHGGLECGVFYAKEPQMDIVCIGPQRDGAHTTEEFLVLDSFAEMFAYILDYLKALTEESNC